MNGSIILTNDTYNLYQFDFGKAFDISKLKLRLSLCIKKIGVAPIIFKNKFKPSVSIKKSA